MIERVEYRNNPEPTNSELKPSPGILRVLRGKISEPVTTVSRKPGSEGKLVRVRLVEKGSGMIDLNDMTDSKEWSGIFNHSVLTTRLSVHVAERMQRMGFNADPQLILDAGLVSHAGRRQSDEAHWYPDAVAGAEEKKRVSNETLGLRILRGNVPDDVFNLVGALAHNPEGFDIDPETKKSLNYLLFCYIDHRTSQTYEPLNIRMGNFLKQNFIDKNENDIETDKRICAAMAEVIGRQRDSALGTQGVQSISIDEAVEIAKGAGAKSESDRLNLQTFMELIIQDAKVEALLKQTGIDPDEIGETTVSMPKWEDNLRRNYVEAAGDEIVTWFDEHRDQTSGESTKKTWWDEYALRLYNERKNRNQVK